MKVPYSKEDIYKLIFDHQLKGNNKINKPIETEFGRVEDPNGEIPLYFLKVENDEEENDMPQINLTLGKILFPSQFDRFVFLYVFLDFKQKFPAFATREALKVHF